jgi:hypothetical protein
MVVKREVRLRASDYPASCYFRINPLFETVAARYDWINRAIDFAQYDRSYSPIGLENTGTALENGATGIGKLVAGGQQPVRWGIDG